MRLCLCLGATQRRAPATGPEQEARDLEELLHLGVIEAAKAGDGSVPAFADLILVMVFTFVTVVGFLTATFYSAGQGGPSEPS